jgi:hypothetical protein
MKNMSSYRSKEKSPFHEKKLMGLSNTYKPTSINKLQKYQKTKDIPSHL